jgi:hypothetical protein
MFKVKALLVAASLLFESIGLNGASAREGPHKGGLPFRGEFGRDFRGFGPVGNYGIIAPSPYYFDSLRCYLHQRVLTPKGWELVPIYVC